ncbi:MAG TPA: hypothetical protein VG796_02775 [Verrucomicrobiales bacterium]|nr:hypothetical protein [Verrucomicrobiales bacterium]
MQLQLRPTPLLIALVASLTPAAMGQITFTPPVDAPAGGSGTIGILEVTNNGNMGDQNNARTSLFGGGTRITGTAPYIDFYNSDGTGRFHNNLSFLSDPSTAVSGVDDVNNIATIYRGTINVPVAGTYTFGVNSDDGFTLAFANGTIPFISANGANGAALQTYNGTANGAFQFFGGRGTADSFAQITLPAGNHTFDFTFHEGGGGSAVELFAASGNKSVFDNTFNLVGGQAFMGGGKAFGTVGTWNYKAISDGNADLASMISKYNNNVPTVGVGGLTPGGLVTTANLATIGLQDPQNANNGGHTGGVAFPGDTAADDNNFGGAGRATLSIAPGQEGLYTFAVYSDDSFRFRVMEGNVPTGSSSGDVNLFSASGGGGTVSLNTDGDGANDAFGTTGCCADSFGRYMLAPGDYTMEAIFNEQGGGAGFFVYVAKGNYNTFDPNLFQLVGAGENTEVLIPAGLQLVPEPGTVSLGLLSALALLSRRRRA